jgi:serine/threonine protein kinase
LELKERYQLDQKADILGEGGFAKVYKAWDKILEVFVAIKIFQSGKNSRYGVMKEIRQIREKRLSHENLVAYFDAFEIEHQSILGEKEVVEFGVMEYMPGGTIKSYLAKHGKKDLILLLCQVLEGLHYLHTKGIIHRDLDPNNILVDDTATIPLAKIADFGISRDVSKVGVSSVLAGKPHFLAPEQIMGKVPGFGIDFWAFGITVFYLVTGRYPFEVPGGDDSINSNNAIQLRITSGLKPEDTKGISEPYISVIEKCLVIDPDQRTDSAKALIQILKEKSPVSQSAKQNPLEQNRPPSDPILPNKVFKPDETQYDIPKPQPKPEPKPKINWKQVLGSIAGLIVLICLIISNFNGCSKHEENPESVEASIVTDSTAYEKQAIDTTVSIAADTVVAPPPFQTFTETVNGVAFDMVAVEGGTFTLGCTSEQNENCYEWEPAVRGVSVGNYYIGSTEVTQALWTAVMGTNPSEFKGKQKPVENVSWLDCQRFIRKLNNLTGKEFRLPTEAEWEFAARGGTKSKGYQYPGSDDLTNVAWYAENSSEKTHPVRKKDANELGLYDMSGNVKEWCLDWYWDGWYSYLNQHPDRKNNPQLKKGSEIRVCRGGCWISYPAYCSAIVRYFDSAYDEGASGFRLVLPSR